MGHQESNSSRHRRCGRHSGFVVAFVADPLFSVTLSGNAFTGILVFMILANLTQIVMEGVMHVITALTILTQVREM